jgi:hypothetical protein
MDTDEPKTVPDTTEHSDSEGKEVEDVDDGPSLVITLLLTTGSRHPFTIDGKYLRKRSVNVENNDPFLMSVYTLKELIWREWRSGRFSAFEKTGMELMMRRLGNSSYFAECYSSHFFRQIVG